MSARFLRCWMDRQGRRQQLDRPVSEDEACRWVRAMNFAVSDIQHFYQPVQQEKDQAA